MDLGKKILELRKKEDVTQDELAAELGVTAAAVSKWENGYTLPDILMLCALADYFSVTTDELLGRNPKPICAAIATSSLPLGSQIQTLLKRYSIYTKHLIYGSYADALETIQEDRSVTHLFVSFDTPLEEHEKDSMPCLCVIESQADTEQKILDGFEIYLKNMSAIQTLTLKNNDLT